MKLEPKYLLATFFLLLSASSLAQYIVVDDNYSAQDLVQNVLINSPCANVSNISVTGWDVQRSYGYFNKGVSSFPFNEGVVLTTGRATSAIGPNATLLEEGTPAWQGDTDLQNAIGENNTVNATVLEFDFLPLANKVSFEYIFSSEQYLTNPNPNQCNFSDGFAFLLREVSPQSPYENLAIVPGTQIPVKITTVRGQGTICPPANEQYFGGFNSVNHPTNYNGQTAVLKAEATVRPNVLYHIKLVVADQGNFRFDSAIFLGGGTFKVEKDLGPNRLLATGNPLCENETLMLDGSLEGTNTYKWFRNGIQVGSNAFYTITQAGTYTLEITLNGTTCIATGQIQVEYAAKPILVNTTLIQCDIDDDGIAIFNLNEANNQISGLNTDLNSPNYYRTLADANTAQNPINPISAFETSIPNQIVYARAQNQYGCFGIAEITLTTSNNTIIVDPIRICDNDAMQDGFTLFNLNLDVSPLVLNSLPLGLTLTYYETIENAQAEINALANNYTNTIANEQLIFAKLKDGTDCFGIAPITLVISTFTPENFEEEAIILCDGETIDLAVEPIFASYVWNTGENTNQIQITEIGNYSLTVTDINGCIATKNFNVSSSSIPVITSVEISNFSSPNNSILVSVTGTGDYEYSINGQDYQDSSFFSNLAPNEYTVLVRDKNGCGIATELVYVLEYPRFFSPNGDGINDTWQINNLDSNAKISIFDRYGKLLSVIFGGGQGWDGKFNANDLPSSDYWFVLDFSNSTIIKGHFTLKR